MRLAVDLHLHSRYAGGVSPAMTVGNIAHWAQRKGLDLLGTGDCLQADWLREIEAGLAEAEPGLFALKPEMELKVGRTLPAVLRRRLRYVLSTEVCCAPPGTPALGGIHHLIYFPSLDSVHGFRARVARHGDLRQGRPDLTLSSRELLECALEHDANCHFAPAHIFNPWFSSLGTVAGVRSLEELFGELTPRLLAVETGLTSTPAMCRRVSSLDRHALFSCSDAHSLENIGRECTLVEIEPGYTALFAALRRGAAQNVIGTLKVPVELAYYYLNQCGKCQRMHEGKRCPHCGGKLVMGSRDRLEVVADRPEPVWPEPAPPFQQLLSLAQMLAGLMSVGPDSKSVERQQVRLLHALGDERYVLTEAGYDEIARAHTPQLARAIIAQRTVPPRLQPGKPTTPPPDQLSLGL